MAKMKPGGFGYAAIVVGALVVLLGVDLSIRESIF